MKSEKRIFAAFILNLFFSAFEFLGGILTGSIAIMSDAVHDMGDAVSIGVSYFLEKKSKGKPNEKYTFGYARYSVLAGALATLVLLAGSVFVIFNALKRIINPVEIDYTGMIILACVGVSVNFIAACLTHGGESVNQKAVNLHMLEDVLGWIVVLAGAIIMRFTDISLIDPLMSMAVALFIFVNAIKNLKEITDIFLEKTPKEISYKELMEHILEIEGVDDVHCLHIWSLDGHNHFASMHLVGGNIDVEIKEIVRRKLREHGIYNGVIETETVGTVCCKEFYATLTHKH
ncbi:MAG: cation transporter [Clostridia bacterium]|nr:cation transporter [Clostridia bacterium]